MHITKKVFENRFLIFRTSCKIGALAHRFVSIYSSFYVNLFSILCEFIFKPIDRLGNSFLSTSPSAPSSRARAETVVGGPNSADRRIRKIAPFPPLADVSRVCSRWVGSYRLSGAIKWRYRMTIGEQAGRRHFPRSRHRVRVVRPEAVYLHPSSAHKAAAVTSRSIKDRVRTACADITAPAERGEAVADVARVFSRRQTGSPGPRS
jgi:hypothetical protein